MIKHSLQLTTASRRFIHVDGGHLLESEEIHLNGRTSLGLSNRRVREPESQRRLSGLAPPA